MKPLFCCCHISLFVSQFFSESAEALSQKKYSTEFLTYSVPVERRIIFTYLKLTCLPTLCRSLYFLHKLLPDISSSLLHLFWKDSNMNSQSNIGFNSGQNQSFSSLAEVCFCSVNRHSPEILLTPGSAPADLNSCKINILKTKHCGSCFRVLWKKLSLLVMTVSNYNITESWIWAV